MKQVLAFLFVLISGAALAQRGAATITSDPVVSQIVCNGTVATLSVTASGTPVISYQWYSNPRNGCEFCDTPLTDGGGYSGTNTRTLSINTTGFFGSGVYYFCRVVNRLGSDYSNDGSIQIASVPTAPTTTGATRCGPGSVTLTSSVAPRGTVYRWYDPSGTLLASETNQTLVTPVLNASANYFVSFANTYCESPKTAATATIVIVPPPTTTGSSSCGSASLVLTASGGTAGQYRWYTVATGGTALSETSGSYTTPVLTATTTYYVAINNRVCESTRTAVTATINTAAPVPTAVNNSGCGPSAVTLSATGGSTGQYRWYAAATGGTSLANTATYTTPVISATTTYYVSINNGPCESVRKPAVATINTKLTPPTTTGASSCASPASLVLSASGAAAGQYRWYTVSSGGTSISTSNTFTTPSISSTTVYYVAINTGAAGTCESNRTPVSAQINSAASTPTTYGASSCAPGSLTLTAEGGAPGQFRWYTVSSGGTAIAGNFNDTYVTPFLTVTTNYYVSTNNGSCESGRKIVTATINTPPSAPGVTNGTGCANTTITLSASGGTSGQYRWYTTAVGGSAITGEINNTFTTPALTTTTNYFVSIDNGTCESTRTQVTATVTSSPNAPAAANVKGCTGSTSVITATGGSAGQYRWYADAVGGTAISGQVNATFTTPILIDTTTYYVSVLNGCESARTAVTVNVSECLRNDPPSILAEASEAAPGGIVTFDLAQLISDPDNNLNFATLKIKVAPLSGAKTFIDANSILTLDYGNVLFSGTDKFTVEICDLANACADQQFSVDVSGDILVYNGISPNGDGKNDYLFIQFIDKIEETKENHLTVYNRWGDAIFETDNYDNVNHVFVGVNKNGEAVPAGTYFYKIDFRSGRSTDSGYFALKR